MRSGNSKPSGFDAVKFTQLMEEAYARVKGEYKPAIALQLKAYRVMQEQLMIPNMTDEEIKAYYRILNDFELRLGSADDLLKECIGKSVHYALIGGLTGIGIIQKVINNHNEVPFESRHCFLSGVGLELLTCKRVLFVSYEFVRSMSLVSEQ